MYCAASTDKHSTVIIGMSSGPTLSRTDAPKYSQTRFVSGVRTDLRID